MTDEPSILVYDSEATGHHREYIRHIVKHGPHVEGIGHLYLAVHPEVAQAELQTVPEGCTPVSLDEDAVEDFDSTDRAWKRSLKEWKQMHAIATDLAVDHCIALTLNWFQLALSLPQSQNTAYTVSGIFFSPYPRSVPKSKTFLHAVLHRGRFCRKRLLVWTMLCNRRISAVHVLNDPAVARHFNQEVEGPSDERFFALPDPVADGPQAVEAESLRKVYAIDDDRVLFLFFGTISRRKGIFRLITAVQELSGQAQNKMALLLMGRLKGGQEEDIRRAVDHARESSDVQFQSDFRFVADWELERALQDCDVVLAPYQRTEGSSGVLGHTARVNKPVIGPRTGLIGELIQEYNLGCAVDVSQTESLRDAIEACLDASERLEKDPSGMERYVEERTPRRFVRRLMRAGTSTPALHGGGEQAA